VDIWDNTGDSIVEHVAGVDDFEAAEATYRAATCPKAKVVDGPLNMGSPLYRIRLSETKLQKEEVGKIVRQMQSESKIVDFIAAKE
jgi:hypothetical protein